MPRNPPARGRADSIGKRGRIGGPTGPPTIQVHSQRRRIERLKTRFYEEGLLFGSQLRWILVAVAWVALVFAGFSKPWRSDSVHHLAVWSLSAAVFFAAFDRRPWLRSLLSTALVLGAASGATLSISPILVSGLALPGMLLFLLTAFLI